MMAAVDIIELEEERVWKRRGYQMRLVVGVLVDPGAVPSYCGEDLLSRAKQ